MAACDQHPYHFQSPSQCAAGQWTEQPGHCTGQQTTERTNTPEDRKAPKSAAGAQYSQHGQWPSWALVPASMDVHCGLVLGLKGPASPKLPVAYSLPEIYTLRPIS